MPIIQVSGDLLEQDVEVIVNAWNRNLIPWWLLLPQGRVGSDQEARGSGAVQGIEEGRGAAAWRGRGYKCRQASVQGDHSCCGNRAPLAVVGGIGSGFGAVGHGEGAGAWVRVDRVSSDWSGDRGWKS